MVVDFSGHDDCGMLPRGEFYWRWFDGCVEPPPIEVNLMRRELEGKVALITGGAAGIGEGAAQLFAEHGAQLILADMDSARGKMVAERLQATTKVLFIETDVRDSKAVQAMLVHSRQEFDRLDILINNAGVEGNNALIHEMPDAEFERVLGVNLLGMFYVTKYTLPWLIASGGGSIVNIASPLGYIGVPQMSAYCTSKGGVIQLTRCTAVEYAKQNIRANCISPGIVDTPMTQRSIEVGGALEHYDNLFDRMAAPREMAEAILFLASERSSFVTGTNLVADGGKTAD